MEQQTADTKHTVQKGEHLWKIAVQYYQDGYKWVDIAKANNLKNPSILAAGQELVIPNVSSQTTLQTQTENIATANNSPPAPSAPKAPTPPEVGQITQTAAQVESISTNSYTVQQGDSLWKISVRAYSDGYQWTKLAKDNKVKNPNHIVPGQTISIPR